VSGALFAFIVLVLVLVLWERVHPVGLSFSHIANAVFIGRSKIEDEESTITIPGAVALATSHKPHFSFSYSPLF
jgi:hypothetical protein